MGRATRAIATAAVTAAAVLFALVAAAPAAAQVSLDAEEAAAIRALNSYRTSIGLEPFEVSPILTRVAEWMAQDQADRDLLSHTDRLGRGIRDRNNAFGYPSNTVLRENLAAGHATGAATMQQWMDSPGHYANNVATDVSVVGIARVPAREGSPYGWFWALEFGSHADEGSTSLDGALAGAPRSEEFIGSGPGTFVNPFPDFRVSANIWNGGSVAQFTTAMTQSGVRAAFVAMADGTFLSYVTDAPSFTKSRFASSFPGGIPANTVVMIVR